jgi:hypothetical protein
MPKLDVPIETAPKPTDKQPALHETPSQKTPNLPAPTVELEEQLTSYTLG